MKREKAKQDPGYIIWLNRLAVAAAIAAIAEAVHIMKNGLGLLEQLDFGAGFLIPGNLWVFLFEFLLCFLKKYLLVLLIDRLTFLAV